ncbi:MAG TPA: helix-turn-helix transcriptional regulator [Solirubrobacter sp.]|nr:helix-turn-helix transcriptional regulator [Solirubrobacter sp.]
MNERLSEAVAESGFTKGFIAAVMGVHPSLLSHWLAGRRPVPEEYRPRLAALLRQNAEALFADDPARSDSALEPAA